MIDQKKKQSHESLMLMKEQINKISWIKNRSNKFNEDFGEEELNRKLLEEDNIVVASWINDMGIAQ